jgi:hypothetical protein
VSTPRLNVSWVERRAEGRWRNHNPHSASASGGDWLRSYEYMPAASMRPARTGTGCAARSSDRYDASDHVARFAVAQGLWFTLASPQLQLGFDACPFQLGRRLVTQHIHLRRARRMRQQACSGDGSGVLVTWIIGVVHLAHVCTLEQELYERTYNCEAVLIGAGEGGVDVVGVGRAERCDARQAALGCFWFGTCVPGTAAF